MTAKKKTTTKKAAPRRPSVKERARAIIADERGYDEDTRDAVRHALEEGHDDLAEVVRRAESGESVLDLTIYQESAERGAAAILALMRSKDVPGFITKAVEGALERASEITGVKYADGNSGECEPGALSDLITLSRGRVEDRLGTKCPIAQTFKDAVPTVPTLTEERACTLADILAPHELYQMPAELRAAALVELVENLAEESDATGRWLIAQAVSAVAYTNTEEFGRSLESFVSRVRAGAFDALLAEEHRRDEKGGEPCKA